MAQLSAYKLVPRAGSAFHFGLRGIEAEVSAEFCPSDSLFAALTSVVADLEGESGVDEFAGAFAAGEAAPPFLLSSAFPYANRVRLFPLPKLRLQVTPGKGVYKRLKNLAFVSERAFRHMLDGKNLDDLLEDENLLQGSKVLVTPEEREGLPGLRGGRIWETGAVPRVTLDRGTSASQIYHVGRVSFAPQCGLYFLVHWRTDGWRRRLEELLAHLGDAGLGGRRSVGHGQFHPIEDGELELPEGGQEGGFFLTLSRYHPTRQELKAGVLGEGASYRLQAVTGWLASPVEKAQRRKLLRLIEEGSILRGVGDDTYGDLADVRPEYEQAVMSHPVYRYGYALPIQVAPHVVKEGEADE